MEASSSPLVGSSAAPVRGALRILSRRGGAQVMIRAGEARGGGAGERLAHINWHASEAVAAELARRCSQFLVDARFTPDVEGRHDFGERQP